VRFKGVAQNPARFLEMCSQMAFNSVEETEPGMPLRKPAVTVRNARVAATYSAPR